MTDKLRFKGQIKSVVISKKADRWFTSISVKTSSSTKARKNQSVAGIGLGVKSLAVSSQGEIFKEAKPHTQKLMRLKRLSRSLFCKKNR